MRIRRRRVFFIEGYEPKGADGFYRMFRREWSRFRKNWNVGGAVSEISLESAGIASWDVETTGPNWQVSTRYEFLRLEHQIRKNLAQPLWLQLGRTIRWMAGDLATGSLARVFRASWRMGVLLSYSQVLLLLWTSLALAGGWIASRAVDVNGISTLAIGIAAALAIFAALRPVAGAMFVNQLNNCWPYLQEFAHGEPTGFDNSVELLAGRIVAAAKAGDADEILVVGHSAGAMLALGTIESALKMDPDLGVRQPNIAVITVGSIMPLFALHPAAKKLRNTIKTISMEPDVLWTDCQASEDFMNFCSFDPVVGVGIEHDTRRCNPLVWQIPFQEMISTRMFKRMRFNHWRKHYQYIMANDRRADYDYYMFVCGPAPFSLWAAQGDVDALFEPDGFYRVPELKAAE